MHVKMHTRSCWVSRPPGQPGWGGVQGARPEAQCLGARVSTSTGCRHAHRPVRINVWLPTKNSQQRAEDTCPQVSQRRRF